MSTVETKPETRISVSPFGIEADHPRNANLLIQCVVNCKLRSAIKAVKEIFTRDPETGEQTTEPGPANMTRGLPANIPGMQFHVDPAKGTYRVIDPLNSPKAEHILERIQKAIDGSGIRVNRKLRGVPTQDGTVDPDRMKTLVRELVRFVDAGEAKAIKGKVPQMAAVDLLPGDYLLEPRTDQQWNRPRYENDEAAWIQTLNQLK